MKPARKDASIDRVIAMMTAMAAPDDVSDRGWWGPESIFEYLTEILWNLSPDSRDFPDEATYRDEAMAFMATLVRLIARLPGGKARLGEWIAQSQARCEESRARDRELLARDLFTAPGAELLSVGRSKGQA